MQCNDGSDEDKEEHAEDGQVEEQCRTIAPFLGSEDNILSSAHLSYLHWLQSQLPPPYCASATAATNAKITTIAIDAMVATVCGRVECSVYNERVDKTLGFPGKEEFAECKQANTPRVVSIPTVL